MYIHITAIYNNSTTLGTTYCHVFEWLKKGFWLVIGFIDHLQAVSTNNYNTTADLHNLQQLHTNLLSLSALVFMDL
jgi:hypothetical protein